MSETLRAGVEVQGLHSTYTISEQLGRGGFAQTFRATRSQDAAVVVLKFLRLDRAESFKALELFEREASVLTALRHPGVPRVYELFAWDGTQAYDTHNVEQLPRGQTLRWVMVQSFAPGQSFAQRMEAGHPLPAQHIEHMLRSVLHVLHYLHGLQPPIIHRDITPANVLLDDSTGHVTLVDFGAIAHRLRSAASVASTSVGTFGFMPMEQMMGQARPASDLYALAVTTIVAATHRKCEDLPLDDATGKIDLQALPAGFSANVARTLDGMLEPIVGQRIPTAVAALASLDGAVLPAVRAPNAVARVERRYGWLWKTSAGVGGLSGAAIYLVFFNSFSESALIQLSALWIAPVVFGISGALAESQGNARPISSAMLWTSVAMGLLIGFIYGIFPAL